MHPVIKSVLSALVVFAAGLLGTFVKAQMTSTAFSPDWAPIAAGAIAVGIVSYFMVYKKQK